MIYKIFSPELPKQAPRSMQRMIIACDEDHINHLHFYDSSKKFDRDILSSWQEANNSNLISKAIHEINEYFNAERKSFSCDISTTGTEFQQLSWEAMRSIPYGHTWSYGQQAKHIGRPKACRAVGAANGKNPISLIIP